MKKYIHLERFGTDEVDNINIGTCHIFPKLDGTNSSVWLEGGVIQCGSRNRVLALGDDNAGFYAWASKQANIIKMLESLPEGTVIYGEWLVPHSLKTYRDDAWRKFYVFDVMTDDGEFLHYDEYHKICKEFQVDFIPCVCVAKNPTYDVLLTEAEKNKFLISENSGSGEGIVIKQYGWKNRFLRTTWAKLITNTFKDKHIIEMGGSVINTKMIEESIADEFITEHTVEKILSKIRNEKGLFAAQHIPMLLGYAFHDLVTEELWEAIKKHKNPKIDFRALNQFSVLRVKKLCPEIFGMKSVKPSAGNLSGSNPEADSKKDSL